MKLFFCVFTCSKYKKSIQLEKKPSTCLGLRREGKVCFTSLYMSSVCLFFCGVFSLPYFYAILLMNNFFSVLSHVVTWKIT